MKLIKNICILLIYSLFTCQLASADDDTSPGADFTNSSEIILSANAQAQAGIQTILLKPASHLTEFTATGKAVNLQPLLSLRNRYLLSITDSQSAKAKLTHSSQNLHRLQDLYEHGITAKRNLQAEQSQLQTEQALVNASQIQAQAIKDEAVLSWGNTLTEWAFTNNGKAIQTFLTGQQTLILVSLPTGKPLPTDARQIYLDASGNRSKAQPGKLISNAPQPDAVLQGEHYFFKTDGAQIKPGMKVTAWLSEQQQQTGVIIPQSAVVWYLNQAYVFLKNAENTFTRLAIANYTTVADGYFIGAGLQPGQSIVTSGVQLLLSEQTRGQIPDD